MSNKLKFKYLNYIHPIFLVVIGTLIGLLPALASNNPTIQFYHNFVKTNKIFTVYIIGLISFIVGYFISKFFVGNKVYSNLPSKPKVKTIFVITLLLVMMLLINVKSYGGIPLLMIFNGGDINHVNLVQSDQSSGIFGIQSLLEYISLILLLPLMIYLRTNKKNTITRLIFWFQIIVLIFSEVYSGKRQGMFILLTTIMSFLWMNAVLNEDIKKIKRIKRRGILFVILTFFLFTIIGLVRSGVNMNFQSIIFPFENYATLPYLNLSNIILLSNFNPYKFTFSAFKDTVLNGAPTFFRGQHISISIMPLIEPTSPNTIYGEIFWNFQYPGIIIFMILVGCFTGFVYKKAISNNKLYMSIYGLCVWPLISINTYNHFLNMMFLLIPVIIVFLIKFYEDFYKGLNLRSSKW